MSATVQCATTIQAAIRRRRRRRRRRRTTDSTVPWNRPVRNGLDRSRPKQKTANQ